MTVVLSYSAKQEIDAWVTKYPPEQKQSAVLYALQIVQKENGGWLTEPLMNAVAAYLGMPPIAVYEVASFYSMFELKPVGRHKVSVCTNISCMLKNADELIQHLQDKWGINPGETSKDGRFTLKEVECIAACGGAPAIQIDRIYYENVTKEKLDQLLAELE